jgi:hypothetical protein
MKPVNLSKKRIVLIGFILVLVTTYLVQTSRSQTSNIIVNAQTGTIVNSVPQTNTPQVGQILTVNLTITNVQNLYALDVTLDWNNSVLEFVSVNLLLGVQAHPGGALYGNQISDTVTAGDVYVQQSNASQSMGEYHLVATSVNPADSFNSSGTIAIITFNVTSLGHSGLDLKTELADHPSLGETSNPINHTDVAGSVDSIIPEFPSIITVVLFLALATVALAFSKKLLKKNLAKQKRLTQESQLSFETHRA